MWRVFLGEESRQACDAAGDEQGGDNDQRDLPLRGPRGVRRRAKSAGEAPGASRGFAHPRPSSSWRAPVGRGVHGDIYLISAPDHAENIVLRRCVPLDQYWHPISVCTATHAIRFIIRWYIILRFHEIDCFLFSARKEVGESQTEHSPTCLDLEKAALKA